MSITYVTAKELLIMHALVIDQTGGTHGVRDVQMLQSLIQKPQTRFGNEDLYPTLWDKAAIFTEAIVNYHTFVDGNKRTAFIGLARFLSINGYELNVSMNEIETTMISLADKSVSIENFKQWLIKHAILHGS